jgi:hypothetical protein
MTRPGPARGGVQRWLVFTAVTVIAAQGLGMAHLALTPHGMCQEHGLFVEMEASATGPAGAARPGVDAAGTVVRSGEHVHCTAATVRRLTPPVTPVVLVLVGKAWEEPAPTETVVALSRRASIQRAPKQSPPA